VTADLYDGEAILRETTNSIPTMYIHGVGLDEPLAREDAAGNRTYYHADGLGSVVKETNAAGTVTLTRKYDAFGNLELGAINGYAFAAREWDAETGLSFNRARYLDSKVGRFISEDPIGFFGGNNFYTYVENDPVNYTDPLGLFKVCCRKVLSTAYTKCHCWIVLDNGETLGSYRFGLVLRRIRNGTDDRPMNGSMPRGAECTVLPMQPCTEQKVINEYNKQPVDSPYSSHNTSNTPVAKALKVLPWQLPSCATGGN